MKRRKTYCGESGVSIVELALVLPLLTMLLLGIIQYGFLFAAYVNLRTASAVGARTAILDSDPTPAQITAVINSSLQPLLEPSRLETPISINTSYTIPGGSSDATRVQLKYAYPLFFPHIIPGAEPNGTIVLDAVTIMR